MKSVRERSSSRLVFFLFGTASIVLFLSSDYVNGLRDLKERDGSESRSMSSTASSSVLENNFYTNVSTVRFEHALVRENEWKLQTHEVEAAAEEVEAAAEEVKAEKKIPTKRKKEVVVVAVEEEEEEEDVEVVEEEDVELVVVVVVVEEEVMGRAEDGDLDGDGEVMDPVQTEVIVGIPAVLKRSTGSHN
ncbi:hypothetical protein HID58_056684 [Brassica napus]|uniref:Uncharacterized protein n=1 Tax=Brassica napus TaxID=3708 RepID=A0ABQ8ANX3_BRANA|nr:hypothetical protein HID58_056684 [Brassica napus]